MKIYDGKAILEKGDVELGRPHKAKRKIWAKLLEGVDTTQKGGYAFQGRWLKVTGDPRWIDDEVPIGSLIVATMAWGSSNHPRTAIGVWKVTEDGIQQLYENYFDHKSETATAVHEIADIFKEHYQSPELSDEEVKDITAKEEAEALLEELITAVGPATTVELLSLLQAAIGQVGVEEVKAALTTIRGQD